MTRYQFDVNEKTGQFLNRRVFAYADTGVPDGAQLDTKGNLYAGCGDGTEVRFQAIVFVFNLLKCD
jgi:gluconolactonase